MPITPLVGHFGFQDVKTYREIIRNWGRQRQTNRTRQNAKTWKAPTFKEGVYLGHFNCKAGDFFMFDPNVPTRRGLSLWKHSKTKFWPTYLLMLEVHLLSPLIWPLLLSCRCTNFPTFGSLKPHPHCNVMSTIRAIAFLPDLMEVPTEGDRHSTERAREIKE